MQRGSPFGRVAATTGVVAATAGPAIVDVAVVVDVIDAGPGGESCAAPYTTDTATTRTRCEPVHL